MLADALNNLRELVESSGTLSELIENASDVAAAGDGELSALYHERMAGTENNVAAVLSAELRSLELAIGDAPTLTVLETLGAEVLDRVAAGAAGREGVQQAYEAKQAEL